ncbi:MAG: serine protease [Rhodobacteraceae bacterium]|nr:serine protease [Paracoccaceae bacterium]
MAKAVRTGKKPGGKGRAAASGASADDRAAAAAFAAVADRAAATWAAVLRGDRADTPERCAAKQSRLRQRAMAKARAVVAPAPAPAPPPAPPPPPLSAGTGDALAEAAMDAPVAAGAVLSDAELEKTFGAEDFVGLSFLVAGLAAAQSVARVLWNGAHLGSGFLVGPDVLATNNHVLSDPKRAERMTAQFGDASLPGGEDGMVSVPLDPGAFFWTDAALDITLVALKPDPVLQTAGFHPLIEEEGKIVNGDGVTVIQHPMGRPLSVVVHNSALLLVENAGERSDFCFYTTDTESGSSGSPVFSRRWEVIAVHRRGVPKLVNGGYVDRDGLPLTADEVKRNPARAVWIANEGVRVSRIVRALRAAAFADGSGMALRRDALLAVWNESRNLNRGQEGAVAALGARLAGTGAAIGQESAVLPADTPANTGGPLIRVPRSGGDIHIHLHVGPD